MRGSFERRLEPYRAYGESLSEEDNEADGDPGTALLYETGFLEGRERAVLLDSAECASRDGDYDSLLELRDINALLLEVHMATDLATRVELGSTSSVGVATANN